MKNLKFGALALAIILTVGSSFTTIADGDPYFWFDAGTTTFTGHPQRNADAEISASGATLSKTGTTPAEDGYSSKTISKRSTANP